METPEALGKRIGPLTKQTVWGYCRVSTDGQEDNQSFGMQREAITKFCVEKKLPAPKFVEEVGSAAKPIWAVSIPGTPREEQVTNSCPRPMFLLLLNHLKRVREVMGTSEKAHLIVWKLDRLARVDYEQELFIEMFRRDGIALHSVVPMEEHMLDGGHIKDPVRAFTRQVLAATATYERAMIEMRMSAGMAFKASKGGYTGGCPPYGYSAKNEELVINPYEARMVRYVYYMKHRYPKMSYRELSRYITANKHPTDTTNYHHAKISRILVDNNRLYRGLYTDKFGTTHPRGDLRIIPDDLETLLDYEAPPSERENSLGLSREVDHGSAAQEGRPGGIHGLGSADGGEEDHPGGMPGHPAGDLPATG